LHSSKELKIDEQFL
jgi:hypothetical protein